MATSHLEPILTEVERRAIVHVLRSHPDWTLGQLLVHLERNGNRSAVLRELTIRELLIDPNPLAPVFADDGGPSIDRGRLKRAEQARGEAFDACVLAVIREAGGRSVGASYLRARVGGPRWKLQSALRRLTDAGEIHRSGKTSSTRYRSLEDRGDGR